MLKEEIIYPISNNRQTKCSFLRGWILSIIYFSTGLLCISTQAQTLRELFEQLNSEDVHDVLSSQISQIDTEFIDGSRVRASTLSDGTREAKLFSSDGIPLAIIESPPNALALFLSNSDLSKTVEYVTDQSQKSLFWETLQLALLQRPTTSVNDSMFFAVLNNEGNDTQYGSSAVEIEELKWRNSFLLPAHRLTHHYSAEAIVDHATAKVKSMKFTMAEHDLVINVVNDVQSDVKETNELSDGLQQYGHRVSVDRNMSHGFNVVLTSIQGEQIGTMRWSEILREVSWSLPGIDVGMVNDEVVPGGLTFEPSMEWMAHQGLAFWLDRSIYQSFASRSEPPVREASASGLNNDTLEEYCDGCTYLKRFVPGAQRGGILEPCCNAHDSCYLRNRETGQPSGNPAIQDCNIGSWIFFWRKWRCLRCNLQASLCFLTVSLVGVTGDNICEELRSASQ